MDDDMDPEMAAALAASMMDVGDGGGGAAAGGGGSSGDFGFAPMMTDSDNTAALEVRLPLGPQERKHALHSPLSDAHFTCAGARGREGSNRCGRASAAGSMQGNVRVQAVARVDKPFGQRVRLSRVGGERRHPHCARDPVSSTACVRCSSHNQGGHNRAKGGGTRTLLSVRRLACNHRPHPPLPTSGSDVTPGTKGKIDPATYRGHIGARSAY